MVDEGLDIGHVDNAPSNLGARGHGGYGECSRSPRGGEGCARGYMVPVDVVVIR